MFSNETANILFKTTAHAAHPLPKELLPTEGPEYEMGPFSFGGDPYADFNGPEYTDFNPPPPKKT